MNKNVNVCQPVLNFLPAILAFLVPIFFLPTTTEFFEYNKLTLFTVGTFVLLLAWAYKMLSEKSVKISKTPLDLPMMGILISYVLSTVFSIDRYSSIFGSQGRWFPSLTAFIILIAFYYAVSSNISSLKPVKFAVMGFLVGTSLSTIIALLGYYGIKLGPQPYLQIPNFTLTGSSTTAGVLAAVSTILATGMLIYTSQMPAKTLYLQAAVVNLFGALLLGGLPSWAVLVTGTVAILYLTTAERIRANKTLLLVLAGTALALISTLIVPTSREVIVNKDYPTELVLSPQTTWQVVSSTLRDFPTVGSGPSTFHLNFPRYKPLELNATDLWNTRFDKAYSEAFGIIGAMGVLGLATTLFFMTRAARFVLTSNRFEHDEGGGMSEILSAGLIGTVTIFIFTYATMTTAFMLILFLALLTAVAVLNPKNKFADHIGLSLSSLSLKTATALSGILGSDKKETFQYIAVIPVFALIVAGGYYTYVGYTAEYLMRESILAAARNDGAKTYELQGRAINLNPQRDVYHNTYAQTNLAIANNIASRENLTDEDKKTIQTLVAQSIRSVRVSTEVINPLNVAGWENRGAIYRALGGVAQDANDWAVRAYNTAIQLDPTNPRLRVELGGIYFGAQDYLSAANSFRQAVSLKNDYANAHYNFAHALIKLQAYADAQRELETVKNLVDVNSADYKQVAADLEELKKQPAVAGAESGKPSVAQLEGQKTATGAEQQAARQDPLTQPGDEQVLNPEVDLNKTEQTQP